MNLTNFCTQTFNSICVVWRVNLIFSSAAVLLECVCAQGSCCLGSKKFLAWLPGSVVWARAALWLQHQLGTDQAVLGMDGTVYPTDGKRQRQ